MSRAPLGDAHDNARVESVVSRWAEEWATHNTLLGVEHARGADSRGHYHWLIRLRAPERDVVTLWMALRQRTLYVETEVAPYPEQNREEVLEYLLAKNAELREVHFALGPERGLYLVAHVPVGELTGERLDELVGATLTYVEEFYPTIMARGFAGYRRRSRGAGTSQ